MTSTPMLSAATLKIGARYNWKNQPERLVYIGMCEPRNGRWHQFEKVDEPGVVWCEVLGSDLHMLEETAVAASPAAPVPHASAGPVMAMRKALAMAVRQNSHDMLMTGEELRQCEAALSVQPAEEQGYVSAFYEMSTMLGIQGPQSLPPEQVYREQIKPALERALAAATPPAPLPDLYISGPYTVGKNAGRRSVCELATARVVGYLADGVEVADAGPALFDAFGNPRVRYVRVIHDGTTCVVPPGDVTAMVDSERPDDYRTQDVYLSKEEFDGLPEFDGF